MTVHAFLEVHHSFKCDPINLDAFGPNKISIGRGKHNLINVENLGEMSKDVINTVSSEHAVLIRIKLCEYELMDVGSSNGTIVKRGGKYWHLFNPRHSKMKETYTYQNRVFLHNPFFPIKDGDEIHIGLSGGHLFTFKLRDV